MNPQGHQVGDVSYEKKDIDVVGIFLLVLLLAVLLTVSLMGVWGLVHFLNKEHRENRRTTVAVERSATFPAPQLEVIPGRALAKDKVTQQTNLHAYGWMDRGKGVVRIPVERAMQLLLERGLPKVGTGQTKLQLMQARPETDTQPQQPITSPSPAASP